MFRRRKKKVALSLENGRNTKTDKIKTREFVNGDIYNPKKELQDDSANKTPQHGQSFTLGVKYVLHYLFKNFIIDTDFGIYISQQSAETSQSANFQPCNWPRKQTTETVVPTTVCTMQPTAQPAIESLKNYPLTSSMESDSSSTPDSSHKACLRLAGMTRGPMGRSGRAASLSHSSSRSCRCCVTKGPSSMGPRELWVMSIMRWAKYSSS